MLIESGTTGDKLELTIADQAASYDARWSARLETGSVTATHGFWSGVEPERLVQFFDDLAVDWRGWDGRRAWTSVEHDLSLAATHDGLGHVLLWVTLGSVVAPPTDTWLVRVPLQFEAGALDRVAAAARGLLADA
jgi:hypothetical protein